MHLTSEQVFPGIKYHLLCFNATERRALERAASILAEARNAAGEDTDLGEDMGKGEVVCRDYAEADCVRVSTELVELQF
jgi:hypothetical protein